MLHTRVDFVTIVLVRVPIHLPTPAALLCALTPSIVPLVTTPWFEFVRTLFMPTWAVFLERCGTVHTPKVVEVVVSKVPPFLLGPLFVREDIFPNAILSPDAVRNLPPDVIKRLLGIFALIREVTKQLILLIIFVLDTE